VSQQRREQHFQKRLDRLLEAVAPCWAGEALIARRYLGGVHRTAARDVQWIGFQIFKEHTGGGVYGGPGETVATILRSAAVRASEISLATPPEDIEQVLGDLQFAVDELRHMTQFIRLYTLAGGDPHRSIESLGKLESAGRLAGLRHELRSTPIGRTAVELSEGGGLGLHFGMQEHFRLSPPCEPADLEIARLTDVILADETHHMLTRFRSILDLDDSERTWQSLESQLVAICSEKLRERNEQFSFPLPEEELMQLPGNRSLGRQYTYAHLGFLQDGV
jgi:hypothetical protein